MRQRIAALLGAFAVVVAGFIALSAPANATTENGQCETGEFCIWQNAWHSGGVYDSDLRIWDLRLRTWVRNCQGGECTVNDNGSSIRNYDTRHYVRTWEHASYSGGLFTRKWANASDELDAAMDLTIDRFSNGLAVNDRISSFCFVYQGHTAPQCRGVSR